MKSLLVALLLMIPVLSQANVTTCQPVGNWKTVTVDGWQNAGQFLYQVHASGIYLVADLICSTDTCVGFKNGVRTQGHLEFAANTIYSMTITNLAIGADNFECQ